MQEKCYNQQSISRFFQTLAHHTDEDGYLYIVKTFKKIRKAFNHIYCAQRRQKDWEFLQAVRQRASLSRGSTFSNPSWETNPAGISPLNSYKQPDGVSPWTWGSGMNSVPEMTDTSSTTGVSPNDARDSGHALTPASNWQLAAVLSDLPGTASFPPRVFGSSNESSYCQQQDRAIDDSEIHPLREQASIQEYQLHSSCQQDTSTSGLCSHQIHTETYCGECADELSPFWAGKL